MKLPSWCSSLLVAFGVFVAPAAFQAQEPVPPSTPAAAVNPVVAQAEATYQQELRDKVEAPLAPLEKRLNDFYRANLAAEGEKAIAQGSLDGALAFQTEAKRFAAAQNVPEQDEPGTLAGLAKLRAAYRAEARRLAQQRAAGSQAALTAHLANLRALERDLTKAKRFDDALAIRARTNALAPALASPPVAGATPPPPAASTPARPLISSSALSAASDKADLYAVGALDITVYLNNKPLMDKVRRERPVHARTPLRVGDVIAARSTQPMNFQNLWLEALTPTGDLLFETSPEWRAYLPKDRVKWWDTKSIATEQPAEFVPQVNGYVLAVLKAASVAPNYHGALPIRSSLDDSASPQPAYFLYHVITKEDLAPKRLDPATRIDGLAGGQSFLGKTVRLATVKNPVTGVVIEDPDCKLGPLGSAPPASTTFKVVKGAEPGTVRFESAATPGAVLFEGRSRLHLAKNPRANADFWIDKAPAGAEGFVISGFPSADHHFTAQPPDRLVMGVSASSEPDDYFLLQEVAAKK